MSKFKPTATPPTVRVHPENSKLPRKFTATDASPVVRVDPSASPVKPAAVDSAPAQTSAV